MSITKSSIIVLLVTAAAATTGCGALLGPQDKITLVSSSDPDSVEVKRFLRNFQRRRLGEEMRGEMVSRTDEEPRPKTQPEPTTARWRDFVGALDRLKAAGGLTAVGRQEQLDAMARTKPTIREEFLPSLTATLNGRAEKLEARAAADRDPPLAEAPRKRSTASGTGSRGWVFDAARLARPASVRRDMTTASPRYESPRLLPSAERPPSQPPWHDEAPTADEPPWRVPARNPLRRKIRRTASPPLSAQPPERKTSWSKPAARANRRARIDQTTYSEPALRDTSSYRWQDHVLAAVDALEDERESAPDRTLDLALEARLRLLYLTAGYKQEALADLPRGRLMSTPQRLAHQKFLQAAIGGLDQYMQHDRDEREPPEAILAKVTDQFRQAADHIGKLASLEVNNVALCQKVVNFGVVEPFATNTFRPQQEVLLYAEVRNFVSEREQKSGQIPKYRTELKSSYRVFDSEGRVVGQGTAFKTITDRCRNYRRDFFISYYVKLPEQMYDGTHTLTLDVTDVQGNKFGQGSVEFEVVAGEKTAAVTRR